LLNVDIISKQYGKKNIKEHLEKSGGTFGKWAVLQRSSEFTKSTDNDSLEINF
jgi:hypothetical protein